MYSQINCSKKCKFQKNGVCQKSDMLYVVDTINRDACMFQTSLDEKKETDVGFWHNIRQTYF